MVSSHRRGTAGDGQGIGERLQAGHHSGSGERWVTAGEGRRRGEGPRQQARGEGTVRPRGGVTVNDTRNDMYGCMGPTYVRVLN